MSKASIFYFCLNKFLKLNICTLIFAFYLAAFITIMTGSKGEDILTHFLHSSLSVCNVCAYENSCETHDQFTYNVYGTFIVAQKGFFAHMYFKY